MICIVHVDGYEFRRSVEAFGPLPQKKLNKHTHLHVHDNREAFIKNPIRNPFALNYYGNKSMNLF